MTVNQRTLSLACLSLSCVAACASDSARELPLVRPPVEAATPDGFLEAAKRGVAELLDSVDIKTRFFAEGPTSILRILDDIDDRITGINTRSAESEHACQTQSPVAYTLTPWGQTVVMQAQCADRFADSDDFVQWGVSDGVTYLYVYVGGNAFAATVMPEEIPGELLIDAWLTVGSEGPDWDSGSYGVIQLQANSRTVELELAVAGLGFGYCGAQLRSDGTTVYAAGSVDMGATCNAVDTLCVAASDVTTPGTCGAALTTFALPALDRTDLTLDGTASDDLHFGPTEPTSGAGTF